MSKSEYRGYWEGPRWARVSTAIKKAAHLNGVECVIEVDKRWITESGRYTLKGDEDILRIVAQQIRKAMEDYNK
jgi:hypothetical protein